MRDLVLEDDPILRKRCPPFDFDKPQEDSKKLEFKKDLQYETLIKEILKNFQNVKLNSCDPDGISPILTKHIKIDEDKIKIIKEAIG